MLGLDKQGHPPPHFLGSPKESKTKGTAPGRYRIGNRFPDGSVIWISGTFEWIDAPHKLVYTWQIGTDPREELVTVSFRPTADGQTEVTVVHERIPEPTTRDRHEAGWLGCLKKLASFLI